MESVVRREIPIVLLAFCLDIFSLARQAQAAEPEVRTWTSADGQFRIQAALVEAKQDSVLLRRDDGKSIEVPLKSLSAADLDFVFQIPPPLSAADSVSALDRAAGELLDAKLAASVFKAYFSAWPASSSSRFAYESSLSKWSAASTAGHVRRGKSWLDASQAANAEIEVENLISQAIGRIRENRGDDAKPLLQKAALADPMSPTASSLAALIFATKVRDYAQAKAQLSEARTRDPLNPSVINDLAVVEVRLSNLATAMNLWQQAIDLAPWSSTIRRNIVNLSRRHSANVLLVPTNAVSMLRSLEDSVAKVAGEVDAGISWAYSPPTDRAESTGYGTGFVVAPGLLISHLPEYKTDRPIFVYLQDQMTVATPAKVITSDTETGVLLLSADTLNAPPLRLFPEFPRPGTNIRIGGFLRPTHITDSLRFSVGAVAAVPTPGSDGLFVCTGNQLLGPGLSPTFNGRGDIIGAVLTVHRLGQPVGFGLPAAKLLELIEAHSPSNKNLAAESQPTAWEQIEPQLRRSIVLVRQPRSERTDLCSSAGLSLEDGYCDRCRGFGAVDCPVTGCANGGILVTVAHVVGKLSNGETLYEYNKVRQPCNTCGGKGKVSCPICNGNGLYQAK